MKKFMLLLLAAMLGIVGAKAQGTGTVVVADGTTTNSYVPIYGLYTDNYLRCQTIYPESMLTEIAGSEIQGITYYHSGTSSHDYTSTFEVKIGACSASSFESAAFDDATTLTSVYTGTLSRASDGTMTINFTSYFTYTGGNLLIEVDCIDHTSDYTSTYFYGVTTTNASVQGYSSTSVAAVSAAYRNFIPKTGFIVPVTCAAPTLGTITTEAHTATVAWTENGTATAWQLKLGDGEWFDVTENPYTLTGLTSDTDYDLRIRSNCGGGDLSLSASGSFTTLVSCPVPTGLTATPAETSIVLAWTEAGSATEWQVKVGDEDWMDVTENPYTIDHLTANTAYAVKVRANCGGGDFSQPASVSTRTLCGVEAFPYSEDFESYTAGTGNFPECWTSVSGTNYVQSGASYVSQGTKALHMQGIGSTVVTPVINIAGNDVFISFDMKREGESSGTVAVGFATSAATANAAIYIDTVEPGDNNYHRYEYTFRNTLNIQSGCIVFKQLTTSSSWYYWLDSLTVVEPPACAKPIDLALDEATENSLTISWTENGSASKWVMKVDDGEWATVTENPYTLDGLTANTEYAISVRSFCDPDTSEAVNGTFRTPCSDEVVTPDDSYVEEFEGIDSGIPSCWAQTASTWESYTTGYTGRGLYFMDYYSHVDTLITPEFNLSALTSGAQLRFWYMLPEEEDWYGNAYSATLEVLYRTSTSGEWTVGETLTDVVEDWTEYEYILPASTAAASYQIAFRAVSASSYTDTYVYLDNVIVETVPSCQRPTSGTITGVTPESAVVTWDAVAGATGYDVAYGETNDVDAATVLSADDVTKTLEGLDPETDYYVWVRTVCGSDNANWLALGMFTTEVACAEVTGLSVTEATTSSITIGWTIDGSIGYESTSVLVGYKEASASDWTVTTATGNSFTLDNLGEGETYNFVVQNICGNDSANFIDLTASTKVCGEIGDGSTVSSYIPTNVYYNYSYSQAIYTAAEVGDIDTIHGISYNYNGTSSPTRTVTVYIADVENAAFADDFMAIDNFTEVATGYSWTIANGWSEIEFDEPFVHESGKDIVIAIDDNTGSYASSTTFAAHAGSGFRYYNDNTNPDPANITVTGTAVQAVADIRFTATCPTAQPGTCDVPTGLAANNVTENSAVISWTGNAAQYEVEFDGQSSTVSTNSYNATGLTAATDYEVRVRALCDGGLTSDWTAMVNFTTTSEPQPTECTTPTGLAVSNITETSANISWNEVMIAETFDGEWNLALGTEDSVHTTITLDATLHTMLQAMGQDMDDVDEDVSIAGTEVPVTIEAAGGNQMNITGSFDMGMIGSTDPVTFHFNTTGTLTNEGMVIAPATISETATIMGMDIDYTGTVTFAYPTELPVAGVLTLEIEELDIDGYGEISLYGMTGTVTIDMLGNDLTASGSRTTTAAYPTYELVVTNVATGVETPITNATTPYALQGLTASTDYTVKVRTHCDENSTSEWSAAVPFTTLDGQQPVECDVPTNVATSNITATAVTVSWTGTASEYQIEVSDGGATPIMQTVSASPYTVEGLTASTNYTVRVRALCENDATSDWSAAVNFTTPNGEQPQGIDDVNASYSVSIYPNPTRNTVTVSVNGLNGKAQVSVIDMSGRTVMTTTMESDATQLNVSKLAQGTYFVRINGESISTVRKLVVK